MPCPNMSNFYRPKKYDNTQKRQKKGTHFESEFIALPGDKQSEINELTRTYLLTCPSFKYISFMALKGKLTSFCATTSEKIRHGLSLKTQMDVQV